MKPNEIINYVISKMTPEFVRENVVRIWVPEFYTESLKCATVAEGEAKAEKLFLDPATWEGGYDCIDEYEIKRSPWGDHEYDTGISFDEGWEDEEAIKANYDRKITLYTFFPGGELGEEQDNIRVEAWVDHTGTKVIAWGVVQD